MELLFWCFIVALVWTILDVLRNRDHQKWIEKTFFAGWKDHF